VRTLINCTIGVFKTAQQSVQERVFEMKISYYFLPVVMIDDVQQLIGVGDVFDRAYVFETEAVIDDAVKERII